MAARRQKPRTRAEVLRRLEQIAFSGGSIAEITACKALLREPEFAAGDEQRDGFAALDAADDLTRRRAKRAA